MGKEIDFFQKNTKFSIEITLTFSLSLAERDALIRDIVTEAPQMRNAADGLDPSLRLTVTLTVLPPWKNFAYISKIALKSVTKSAYNQPVTKIGILDVSDASAQEIYHQLSLDSKRELEIKLLKKLLKSSSLQHMFRESKAERRSRTIGYFLREMFGPGQIHADLQRSIEVSYVESGSYEAFVEWIKLRIKSTQDELERQKEPLRNKVITFAGEWTAVPNRLIFSAKMDKLGFYWLSQPNAGVSRIGWLTLTQPQKRQWQPSSRTCKTIVNIKPLPV